MGGMVDSAGGFLGTSKGPQSPDYKSKNSSLSQLNDMNSIGADKGAQTNINEYANGGMSLANALNGNYGDASSGSGSSGFAAALATDPRTGSKMATEQVQNNPILGQLYGEGGQMSKQLGQYGDQYGKLTDLQNQGFDLKPEDQSLYGQMSGSIARQFGQQGNQAANSLASRGLSSSGAAGAQFSGLAGNQNEMLANAQQQIAQQRVQNTMQQIGQQQQFLSQMGGNINNMGANAAGAVNQQYGRNLSGVQQNADSMQKTAGLQNQANQAESEYGLQGADFNAKNKPENFMDQSIANSNTASNSFAKGLGSMGAGAM